MSSYRKSAKFLVTIFLAIFTNTNCLNKVVQLSRRIKPDILNSNAFDDGSLYVIEFVTRRAINDCIYLCKAKKACKFINFYRLANLCSLIGVIGNKHVQIENYLEIAPGYYFGAKEKWNMDGFTECDDCNDNGVCNDDGDSLFQKCQLSGCSPPVGLKNSIILGNIYSIGKRIRRKCVKGYWDIEPVQETSFCLSNGTWSHTYRDCLPDGVYDVNGTFYKFSEDVILTWDDGKMFCEGIGGNLVKIESQQEQNILEDIIRKRYNQTCYWIGGRRINGVLKWWDGQALVAGYINMAVGEPNGIGNCVDLLAKFDYRWNDAFCYAKCNFICKIADF